jgi:hypothetical protein
VIDLQSLCTWRGALVGSTMLMLAWAFFWERAAHPTNRERGPGCRRRNLRAVLALLGWFFSSVGLVAGDERLRLLALFLGPGLVWVVIWMIIVDRARWPDPKP